MELDKPEAIIHALGSDLNEAARILALDPVRMGVEVAKLAMRADAGPGVSAAARPITPVGARGAAHTAISADDPDKADRLSTAEWMKRREAAVAAKHTGR